MRFILSLVLLTTSVLACEPECRRGVAKAFAQHYGPVIQLATNSLEKALMTDLAEVPLPDQLDVILPSSSIHEGLKEPIQNAMQEFVSKVAASITLENGIFSVMFAEEAPFKGDCNHPKRLDRKMPPAGESWRVDECEKMDYICGNPPSICYFRNMIRDRIVKRIKALLAEYATYDNGLLVHILSDHVKRGVQSSMAIYGAGSMLEDPSTTELLSSLMGRTVKTLDRWISTDVSMLCQSADQQTVCKGWDDQIIPEILKWP